MKVLGFLFVLALFGGGHKSLFDKVSDFSVDVQKVGQLFVQLFKNNTRHNTNEPVFTIDDVRKTNFVNKGTVAKYYSKSLRDYIVYHNVSSEEEGFVITLHNEDESSGKDKVTKDRDKKEIENKEPKVPTVFFLPNPAVDMNEVDGGELNLAISEYVDDVQNKINLKNISYNHKSIETVSDNLTENDANNQFNAYAADEIENHALEELSKESKPRPTLEEVKEAPKKANNEDPLSVNNNNQTENISVLPIESAAPEKVRPIETNSDILTVTNANSHMNVHATGGNETQALEKLSKYFKPGAKLVEIKKVSNNNGTHVDPLSDNNTISTVNISESPSTSPKNVKPVETNKDPLAANIHNHFANISDSPIDSASTNKNRDIIAFKANTVNSDSELKSIETGSRVNRKPKNTNGSFVTKDPVEDQKDDLTNTNHTESSVEKAMYKPTLKIIDNESSTNDNNIYYIVNDNKGSRYESEEELDDDDDDDDDDEDNDDDDDDIDTA